MGAETDAEEPVRKVYFEYLTDRFKDDAVERRHRVTSFETGHPTPSDVAAINVAREKYIQTLNNGGTERQGTDAARDALYGQFDREQIKQREIDPIRYRNDPDYYERMNKVLAEKVEQRREERELNNTLNRHGR